MLTHEVIPFVLVTTQDYSTS